MRSDFCVSARAAREDIDVPALPLEAIRRGARRVPARAPIGRATILAALAAGFSMILAAAPAAGCAPAIRLATVVTS